MRLLIAFLLSFLTASTVHAQAVFDYAKAYQDYEYNLSAYNTAYDDYKLAREQYLQFNTITAKDEAKAKTLVMLQTRDETVSTYLTALRMKIKETDGITDAERESLYNRIDPEVKWYTDHKAKLDSAGTLEDLVSDSNEAKDHYNFTSLLIYDCLIQIISGKTANLRSMITANETDLKLIINVIRQNQDKDTSLMERALPDIEDKLARSADKDTQAINTNSPTTFTQSQSLIEDSYLYLKEANANLSEIVRQIESQ
ncbi:MAG: hypothetical protein ABSA43_01095 [Candidatus Microgenomates bacterium]|jgi:hypothetical protein